MKPARLALRLAAAALLAARGPARALSRIGTLTRVLEYLQSLGDAVWVARRQDIARVWREQFPALESLRR